MSGFHNEIYNVKANNTEQREKGPFRHCEKCKEWQGHKADCPNVTVDGINILLQKSYQKEEWARKKAAEWLKQLQLITAKFTVVKHENNKLRAENQKLRKELGK